MKSLDIDKPNKNIAIITKNIFKEHGKKQISELERLI